MKDKSYDDVYLYDDEESSAKKRADFETRLKDTEASPEDLAYLRQLQADLKTIEEPTHSEDFVRRVLDHVALNSDETEAHSKWHNLFQEVFQPKEWVFAGALMAIFTLMILPSVVFESHESSSEIARIGTVPLETSLFADLDDESMFASIFDTDDLTYDDLLYGL